ncbi:Lamina-associated polypeptide 2, isoform alpha [Takifugu flavidus]|uniref:Lamina-associated polypeptide 2, isoform alpha n=1 Tax=Takifugu flavidus TaxID=433684 RepID=A0A5C6MUF8_9TELE|nr:Lamina-associated polypeptide 2, isoform alpha [Takifugu flavidus]
MPLLEDPARLSKSRLKSDLLAHNVALPPANSRKDVYVELHLKHIEQKDAAEFSSDEEDRGQDEAFGALRPANCNILSLNSSNILCEEDEVVDGDDPGGRDPSALTDDGLKAALIQHGVKVGPIVASTRAVYEKKLRKLLESGGHDEQVNGEEGNAVLYSDSEDEEGSKGAKGEGDEHAEHSQQDMSQVPNGLQPAKSIGCSSGSSQAFSITQMVEEESQFHTFLNPETRLAPFH